MKSSLYRARPLFTLTRQDRLARISQGPIEFRPDHRVIRCAGRAPRVHVYIGAAASGDQRRRCKDMIDAPSPVIFEGVPEVIPIGVLNNIRVELSEHIHKSPVPRLLVGVARVDMEIDIVDTFLGMVNVNRLGSDV